jgi:PBP1b-binding outer membrane lipoprotein LpoB
MKNWASLLVIAVVMSACSTPKATISQKSATLYSVQVKKTANQAMEIVDVQMTDGSQWASGSFRLTDASGKRNVLNTKGYEEFSIQVVTPSLTFVPNQALVSYRLEADGPVKSMLLELTSIPAPMEAEARPTLAE